MIRPAKKVTWKRRATNWAIDNPLNAFSSFVVILRKVRPRPTQVIVPFMVSFFATIIDVLTVYSVFPLIHLLIGSGGSTSTALEGPYNSVMRLVDRLVPGTDPLSDATVITLSLFCLRFISLYGAALSCDHSTQRYVERLRNMLFERMMKFGIGYYDRGTLGDKTITFSYTNQIRAIIEYLQAAGRDTCLVLGYLAILVILFGLKGLATFTLIGLMLLGLNSLLRTVKHHSKMSSAAMIRLYSLGSEAISAIKLIKSVGTHTSITREFVELSRQLANANLRTRMRVSLAAPLQEGVLAVTLLAGLLLLDHVDFELDSSVTSKILVGVLIFRRMTALMSRIGQKLANASGLMGTCAHLVGFLEETGKHYVKSGPEEFTGLSGEIEFDRVGFAYGDETVLKDVSMRFPRGKKVAIVGQSGSGKSTVIKLLMRFYDVKEGRILLNGRTVTEYSISSLMRHISLMSQEVILLNRSVRENLQFGLETPPSDDVIQAILEAVRVSATVNGWPKGLDTVIGERGVRLSEGERQRLGLARALVRGAEIYLLDEPTSALDAKTEMEIQDLVGDLVRDRTVITIAHRLATVRAYDYFYVMHQGAVVEHGTLSEVLAKNGYFSQLWRAQGLNHAA